MELYILGKRVNLTFFHRLMKWFYKKMPIGIQRNVKALFNNFYKRRKTRAIVKQPLQFEAKFGNPLVSIILPVYNHIDYVTESIDSILNQSYSNIELIIVDDGSNQILLNLLKERYSDKRIKYTRQFHAGLPQALNNGFRHSKGQFLTWTSADNVMGRTNIEEMLTVLHRNSFAGMVYCDYSIINEKGNRYKYSDYRVVDQDVNDTSIIRVSDNISRLDATNDNFIGACFLYRRMVTTIGDYDDAIGVEDYDYWVRISNHFEIIHHVPYDFYEYRVHSDSLSFKQKELKIIEKCSSLLNKNRERKSFINNYLLPEISKMIPFHSGALHETEVYFKDKDFKMRIMSFQKFIDEDPTSDYLIIILQDVPNYDFEELINCESDHLLFVTFNQEVSDRVDANKCLYIAEPNNLKYVLQAHLLKILFEKPVSQAKIEIKLTSL